MVSKSSCKVVSDPGLATSPVGSSVLSTIEQNPSLPPASIDGLRGMKFLLSTRTLQQTTRPLSASTSSGRTTISRNFYATMVKGDPFQPAKRVAGQKQDVW
jgi:hypothetical protein